MEIIRDITALEELPEAAATGLHSNTQGHGSWNCQGTGATCNATCGVTSIGG
ncbi:MAG: hypothetical protein ACRDRU_24920 [Pseudonocardiaceae bacterium]